jgi:hypothetical protein
MEQLVDVLFLGLVLVFFLATGVLISFCDSLREDK